MWSTLMIHWTVISHTISKWIHRRSHISQAECLLVFTCSRSLYLPCLISTKSSLRWSHCDQENNIFAFISLHSRKYRMLPSRLLTVRQEAPYVAHPCFSLLVSSKRRPRLSTALLMLNSCIKDWAILALDSSHLISTSLLSLKCELKRKAFFQCRKTSSLPRAIATL